MENIVRIALVGVLFQIGFCLRIENIDDPNQTTFVRVVREGQDLVLKCREVFEDADENFGVNPLKWHKIQREEDREDPELGVEVSSFSSVHSVFQNTGRISASFDNAGSNLDVNLAINNLQREDSGWYFCYAKKGQQIFKIRYDIQVYVPPISVMLTGRTTGSHNESTGGTLTFYSNQKGSMTCTAIGGYPVPTLKVRIQGEQNQLSGHGTPTTSYQLQGEIEGLQQIVYNASVTVSDFQARADQNDATVICTATTPNSQDTTAPAPITDTKRISVLFPPKIVECSENWRAAIGDGNIKFWCTFEANPVPDVKWMALTGAPNVEIQPDGKVVEGLYSAVVKVTSQKAAGNVSVFETVLTLETVTRDSFHRYSLHLMNDVGDVSKEFLLDQGESGPVGGSVGSASFLSTSSLLIFTVFTLVASLLRQ